MVRKLPSEDISQFKQILNNKIQKKTGHLFENDSLFYKNIYSKVHGYVF